MTLKRHMANAAPYIISSLMMFAVTKSNANAQITERFQTSVISLDNHFINENMDRCAGADKVYEFLADHCFTLSDFDLDDYHFSESELKKLIGSKKNDNMLRVARKRATRTGSFSHCYRGVKRILAGSGISLGPIANERSAYMAANSLAIHPDFIEINCEIKDIPNLPDGTIITWGRSRSRPHGHIEIKDGDIGRCDAKYNLRTEMGPYTQPHFFVLRDTNLDTATALQLIQENRLKPNVWDSICNKLSMPAEQIAQILGVENRMESQHDLAKRKSYKSFALPNPVWVTVPDIKHDLKLDSDQTAQTAAYDKYMQKVMYIRNKRRNFKTQRSRT